MTKVEANTEPSTQIGVPHAALSSVVRLEAFPKRSLENGALISAALRISPSRKSVPRDEENSKRLALSAR